MKHSIWIAYSKEPPFLPVAVADTAKEIAMLTGTTQNSVWSAWRHYSAGEYKSSRFHKVRLINYPQEGYKHGQKYKRKQNP